MRSGNSQAGFSYLLLLIWLSIMAFMLLESQDLIASRFRQRQEAQLLFNGNQIREAINHYRGSDNINAEEDGPKDGGCFPTDFAQLLTDNRGQKPVYHLRKVYLDPFMPKKAWIKVFDAEGRWIGVHSSDQRRPLKKMGFSEKDNEFSKAKTYQEWIFKVDEDPAAPLPDQCKK